MTTENSYYGFRELRSPIVLRDSETLIPVIKKTLKDWHFCRCDSESTDPAIIEISSTSKGYTRKSPWKKKSVPFPDPVDAVCDLIVDLIHAYIADQNNMICLHSGAVAYKDGLMLFPNTYRSGKSTLAVKLASVGYRIFSDDVLPIRRSDGQGIALGIQPRLRLPIPDNSDDNFREFVIRRSGPGNKRYLYIDLQAGEQATLGETAPIKGIVLLQRDENVTPSIEMADGGIILRDVILRNFARQIPAIEILDLLNTIVQKSECFVLRYSTLMQAVELLSEIFELPDLDSTCRLSA